VISHTTQSFRKLLDHLPQKVRRQVKEAYSRFKKDPYYPALHFKRVHSARPIYSVRISIDYRALGILQDDEIVWFWIGSHAEYDKTVKQQRKT